MFHTYNANDTYIGPRRQTFVARPPFFSIEIIEFKASFSRSFAPIRGFSTFIFPAFSGNYFTIIGSAEYDNDDGRSLLRGDLQTVRVFFLVNAVRLITGPGRRAGQRPVIPR